MYGSIIKAGEREHSVFKHGIPIPYETVKNELVMDRVRRRALYNVDLPGNIEDVHPNKFIADLRPIEDFKHTPVVPIEEKQIKEFKQKIEDKKREGVYFEVKKETLYYYAIVILFCVFLYQLFGYVYKENEKIKTDIEKIKLRRIRYNDDL